MNLLAGLIKHTQDPDPLFQGNDRKALEIFYTENYLRYFDGPEEEKETLQVHLDNYPITNAYRTSSFNLLVLDDEPSPAYLLYITNEEDEISAVFLEVDCNSAQLFPI